MSEPLFSMLNQFFVNDVLVFPNGLMQALERHFAVCFVFHVHTFLNNDKDTVVVLPYQSAFIYGLIGKSYFTLKFCFPLSKSQNSMKSLAKL